MGKKNIDVILKEKALAALKKAYSPFSKIKVGAALLCSDGEIIIGCNVENSSYGLSMCAERTAVFKAVSSGKEKFKKVCIATNADKIFTPCGACRQVLHEFCDDLEIICITTKGKEKKFSLKKLLPDSFRL